MKKTTVAIVFVILMVLHQDFWNWDNSNLVFGIMPVALAYHAVYSMVVATFWALVIRFAWPKDIEEWANGEDSNSTEKPSGDRS